VQRDKFPTLRPFKNSSRKHTSGEYSNAAKSNSCDQSEANNDETQNDDIHQKVREIVSLGEMRVLVPGDVGVIIHRRQQRLGLGLRERTSYHHPIGPVRLSNMGLASIGVEFAGGSCSSD